MAGCTFLFETTVKVTTGVCLAHVKSRGSSFHEEVSGELSLLLGHRHTPHHQCPLEQIVSDKATLHTHK